MRLKRRACLPSLHEKRVTQNINLANVTIVTACRMPCPHASPFLPGTAKSAKLLNETADFERHTFCASHLFHDTPNGFLQNLLPTPIRKGKSK